MTFEALRDAFLAHFWSTHPVDGSFAGVTGCDDLFAPVDAAAPARESAALRELLAGLDAAVIPDSAAARIDARLMHGYLVTTVAQNERRSRYTNPAWYTGEIAFGIVALLLPGEIARNARAIEARIACIPDLLASAAAHLAGLAVPADWVERARLETRAIVRLLQNGLPLHPLGATIQPAQIAAAVVALTRFETSLDGVADADPAAGPDLFALLVREVHGFDAPAQIERDAAHEFERLLDLLQTTAATIDPTRSWREQTAALLAPGVLTLPEVLASLTDWHDRSSLAAEPLVTPTAYELSFAPMPVWASEVYGDLYFLFYRSPPAFSPGRGSIYWATAPQSTAAIKIVHAIHHGSIGHHTQNARARSAASLLARIAGSDGPSGIALLGGGSLGEGWACYVEELLTEVPDFYTPQELLLLAAFELRNVATCLGDLRLHTGVWSLADMRRFYRDDAGFAAERVWSETTRNSIFPASRIMYWLGTREIRAMRARSPLGAKAFHDTLLSYGAAPVTAIDAEMQAPVRQ